MVIDAESVAKDCQQSQIMERLHQNRISKCTAKTNQQEKKKKDSSGLSKNTATEISSAVLMRRFLPKRTKVD